MEEIKSFIKEEGGMTTVEVILIIVVLIALVVIFKSQITGIVNNIMTKVTNQTNKV